MRTGDYLSFQSFYKKRRIHNVHQEKLLSAFFMKCFTCFTGNHSFSLGLDIVYWKAFIFIGYCFFFGFNKNEELHRSLFFKKQGVTPFINLIHSWNSEQPGFFRCLVKPQSPM